MLCQSCGKNGATTFLKKTVNGETSSLHLCSECAGENGIKPFFAHSGFDIGDFWGSLFSEPAARIAADDVKCESCSKTFREIAKTGKAGCPACYTAFYDRLLPSIRQIHGETRHTGKIPEGAGESIKKERELEQLRRELNDCIANQQFEKCSGLRDRIRDLEAKEV